MSNEDLQNAMVNSDGVEETVDLLQEMVQPTDAEAAYDVSQDPNVDFSESGVEPEADDKMKLVAGATIPTVAKLLSVARATLGTSEVPAGSNKTPFGVEYGWNGVPWCDIWVSDMARRATGDWNFLGKFAYTVYHAQYFQKKGQWHPYGSAPQPGDIVFFDWGKSKDINKIDHVGIVEGVNSNGTITVLNGNYGDAVRRTVFNTAAYVVGYGRPSYATPPPPPAPATTEYSVRPDDNLTIIAAKFHTTVAALVALNHLRNPDVIFVGQRLKVVGSVAPTIYVVRSGDNLTNIAKRFNTTVAHLVAVNHIRNANVISIGQRLVVS